MDILVQSKRDKKAAKKFFRKLLKRLQYVPSLIVTDKVAELWSSQGCCASQCRTPAPETSEQSRREFTSANVVARACEAIQVTGPRAAFSLGLRNHFLTLSSGATPLPSLRIPRCHEIEIRPLGSRNWKWDRCLLRSHRYQALTKAVCSNHAIDGWSLFLKLS